MVRVRRCQASTASARTGTGRGTTVHSGPGGEGQKDPKRAPAEAEGHWGVRPGGEWRGRGRVMRSGDVGSPNATTRVWVGALVRPLRRQGLLPVQTGIAPGDPGPWARRPSPMFQHRGKARAPKSKQWSAEKLKGGRGSQTRNDAFGDPDLKAGRPWGWWDTNNVRTLFPGLAIPKSRGLEAATRSVRDWC
jgi:hypothetical protein